MAITIKDIKKDSGAGDRTLAAWSTNPAVGDIIVVQYSMFGGTKSPTVPTDTQGNTYTQIGTQSGGANTQIVMYMAKVTTAGATTTTAHGTWTFAGVVAWLISGPFSTNPYSGDFLTAFASTTSVTVGPTTVTAYTGSIFIGGASVAANINLGDPSGYNTEGSNGFTSALHTAAVLLTWSSAEDLQTAYKISSGFETVTWPTSASGAQWAAQVASFSPARVPLPTSVSPTGILTSGGTQITITGTAGSFGSWVTGVTVGGTPATVVVVVNGSTITCTAPAHAAGPVNIVVTGSEGDAAPLAGLTYYVQSSVSITGTGGAVVSGGAGANYSAGGHGTAAKGGASGGGAVAILKVNTGYQPELNGNQWGLHEFTMKPRKEETS